MTTMTATPITIPYPNVEGELELRLEAGACRLHVMPGEDHAWITGTYEDPSGTISVESSLDGNRALLRLGRSPADILRLMSGIPELTVVLGKQRPFRLGIVAGASENDLELGGLPISRLEINQGAGSVEATFSKPSTVPLRLMKFGVGAGKTCLYGLANANFEEIAVEGGAASCVLDFSGSALQNGSVRISTAMASVEARVPEGLATEVASESLLGQPHPDAGFIRRGGAWLNHAAALGKPVQLRIRSTMVMGQLRLSTIA